MIDISKNIIHKFISEKSCKMFIKKPIYAIPEKQMRSVFTDFLKHKDKKQNFLFTKNTIERILKMDISNVKPSSLSFLGEKYNNEFSFCFLEKEKISFCYSIDVNSVKIIVFNGNSNSEIIIQKAIVGSAIINFSLNELNIIPANAIYFIDKQTKIPQDYLMDLKTASNNEDFMKNLKYDFDYKTEIIFLAIKSFVFLKTASVIDKTFISQNNKFKIKSKYGIVKENKDIIVINSFYDETINVLNPFSVSGHFRKQPKKNGVEIIYIDSFMKKGYFRPAKILTQANSKD